MAFEIDIHFPKRTEFFTEVPPDCKDLVSVAFHLFYGILQTKVGRWVSYGKWGAIEVVDRF